MSLFNPVFIKATTIPDAWHQAVFNVLEHGRPFKIDKGSYEGDYRLEFDYVFIEITHPESRPFEPEIPPALGIPNPVERGYILGDDPNFVGEPYINYIMTGNKKEGEDYTYGQRLVAAENKNKIFDQVQHVIDTYKNFGFRNNQMCLQIASPTDMLLNDPPCLRHIDTRIQDGYLHFMPYFRSWDLWGGFPANLAGLQILKEFMANEIGVEPGETIATSKGLHLYKFTWKLAEIRRQSGDLISRFLKEIGDYSEIE